MVQQTISQRRKDATKVSSKTSARNRFEDSMAKAEELRGLEQRGRNNADEHMKRRREGLWRNIVLLEEARVAGEAEADRVCRGGTCAFYGWHWRKTDTEIGRAHV